MAVGSLLLSLSPPTTSSSSLPAAAVTRRTRRHYGNDNTQKSTPHSPFGLQWRSRRGLLSPLLSSRPKLEDLVVECNPDEEDITEANVGVLGCSPDQVCLASEEFPSGGFCYPSSSLMDTRSLQYEGFNYDVCDPTLPYFENYGCDCTDFDMTTKTGSIICDLPTECLGSQFNGCADTCMDTISTISFVNGTSGDYEQCNEIISPPTAYTSATSFSFCLQLSADSSSCQMEVEGYVCTPCTYSPELGVSVNCSNVDSGDAEPGGPIDGFLASLPIIQACYLPGNSTAAPTSSSSTPVDKTVAPGAEPSPPTAAPNSAAASAFVPLVGCSTVILLMGVSLLFANIE